MCVLLVVESKNLPASYMEMQHDSHQFCQKQMAECDRQLEQYFHRREDRT
jgi:hypothetical protein